MEMWRTQVDDMHTGVVIGADPVVFLSQDLTRCIFSHVKLSELAILGRVSKAWREAVRDADLWRNIRVIEEDVPELRAAASYARTYPVGSDSGIRTVTITGMHVHVDFLRELSAILERSPNLIALDLSRCRTVDDSIMNAISHCCKELRSLCLVGCTSISEEAIIQVVEACPKIKDLQLNDCIQVSGKLLSILALYPQRFETLSFSGIKEVTDEMLEAITKSQGKALLSLNVSHCKQVTSLARITAATPNLREIRTNWCRNFGDVEVALMGQSCRNLEVVSLGWSYVTSKGIVELASTCTKLRYLDIRGTLVGDEGLHAVASLQNISVVIASNLRDMTDSGAISILRNSNIRRLCASRCPYITNQSSLVALEVGRKRTRAHRLEADLSFTSADESMVAEASNLEGLVLSITRETGIVLHQGAAL